MSQGQLHREAERALAAGRLREAHALCLEILREDPRHADAWFLCGVIAAGNGQREKALEIFSRATTLAPGHPDYHAETGKTLIALRRHREALEAAELGLACSPRRASTWNTLGTVFSHAGEHERALACFTAACARLAGEAATGLGPAWQADLHFNLGASSKFCGDFPAARQAYERAIALQPTHFRAHAALAQLGPERPGSHHLERLEPLREQVRTAEDQLNLGHAIAREREDTGDYTGAMQALQWAKQRLRSQLDYRVADDEALLGDIATLFGRDQFGPGTAGLESAEPIFIVGMPRSGTTLVERILGAHSQAYAAGELPHFPLAVKRLGGTAGSEVLNIETLRAGLALNPRELGQCYLDSTRPRTGHTPHFIDKLPLNFAYLGLIRRALPRARFICLRRNPLDTCLSNYRQQFASNFPYYRYALDLEDCGRYYLAFDRLIRHWQRALPGGLLEVEYEALVGDTETQARRLLAWCGLSWEPACLEFQHHTGAVATASAVQVRRGIYRDGIQRWRRYGAAVAPLQAVLASGAAP